LLTHVLGYVARLDEEDLRRVDAGNYRGTTHIGKSGIERFYEDELHGNSGIEKVETNAQGRVISVLERQDPVHGDDLILSLDVLVQQAAWDALGDRAGAVVAMDPNDGSILAMVSKPSFDANDFVHGISNDDYSAILNAPNRPLFNRALLGGYEPGSTLKPFVGLLHARGLPPLPRLEGRWSWPSEFLRCYRAIGQHLFLPAGPGNGN
jgi:penicillin-binding protein 2